jgi:hypothetical protein
MKIKMVAKIAGTIATMGVQTGLDPRGDINQPRPDQVGLTSMGTVNLGVSTLTKKSIRHMVKMAMMTAKSEMKFLT